MSFNPNQPRVPAGSPGGGQWAGHGSEAGFREHFAKQMRGEFGIRERDIQRRLDVMVKEHLETAAARADYHATRKPGPQLSQKTLAKFDARMLESSRAIDAMQSAHAKLTGQALNRQSAAEKVARGEGPGFSRLPPLRSRKP